MFAFDVETLDPSALQIFGEIVEQYSTQGIIVFFSHVKPSQKEAMRLAGIVDTVGEGEGIRLHAVPTWKLTRRADHFLPSVNDALRLLQSSVLSSTMTIP